MTKRKTHEEFVKEVIETHGDIYEFLTKYYSATKKIKVKHKACGYVWDIQANVLLDKRKKKYPCPYCNKKIPYTTETFKNAVSEIIGKEYMVLGKYKNNKTKIKMKHLICGCEYDVSPQNILNLSNRCPNCFGTPKKTTEQFKQEVFNLTGREYIVIGEYITVDSYILIKHINCGSIYEVRPNSFLRGSRCPKCKQSKGEKAISILLDKNNIKYKSQYIFNDCKNESTLPFDFAIFNKQNNLIFLIEYDGRQHFEPVDFAGKGDEWAKQHFIEIQKHDQIKNQYCIDNNIPLYRIPYWMFDDIEEILNNLIKGKKLKRIGKLNL